MGPVEPDERISRFVIKRNIKNYTRPSDGTVKHNAFMPAKKSGSTSVFRTHDVTDTEVCNLGNIYVAEPQDQELAGRVEITASSIYDKDLSFEPDNTPPRHANIVNWPAEDSDKKSKAQELAALANYTPC